MGLRTKEKKIYFDALIAARNIVAISGMQGLEREIERQQNDIGNKQVMTRIYTNQERTALARASMEEELKVLATSIATVLSYEMNFPMSIIMEFFKKFNDKIELFRKNPDERKKAEQKLSNDHIVDTYCEKYINAAGELLDFGGEKNGK